MPRLLTFLPCERVAFDAKDSTTTLISIFQGFEISAEKSTEITKGTEDTEPEKVTAIPLRWAIFSLWKGTDDEVGRSYEQVCELNTPSGKLSFSINMRFKMTKEFQRNTFNITNFPIVESGDYIAKTALREVGEDDKVMDQVLIEASYPIRITHKELAETAQA